MEEDATMLGAVAVRAAGRLGRTVEERWRLALGVLGERRRFAAVETVRRGDAMAREESVRWEADEFRDAVRRRERRTGSMQKGVLSSLG